MCHYVYQVHFTFLRKAQNRKLKFHVYVDDEWWNMCGMAYGDEYVIICKIKGTFVIINMDGKAATTASYQLVIICKYYIVCFMCISVAEIEPFIAVNCQLKAHML